MHYKEDIKKIDRRIIAIASRVKEFTEEDCRDAHFAEHMMDDWRERLEAMAKKGKLATNGSGVYWKS